MPVDAENIRRATRDDIPRLNALFEDVFGERRDAAVWEWKYVDNPRGARSIVCEAGDQIVAHCAGTPVVMQDGDRQYIALQSVDFMSTRRHPGGIGKGGVFYRVVQKFFDEFCGERGAAMVYGFPGERHRLVGEKILGYAPVEVVGELTLEPSATGASAPLEPLDPYLALLSQAATGFGGVRDSTYIDWRYRRHPLHRYYALPVHRWPWRKPQLIAIVRETADEVLLMELEGTYSAKLIDRMCNELRKSGRRTRAWGSLQHERGRALAAAGFATTERPHRLETRFFFKRAIPSPGDLYYSLGDYDVF